VILIWRLDGPVFYIDDFSCIYSFSISLSDHLLVTQAQELQQMCQSFLGDIEDFQKIADGFISIFDTVSKVYIFMLLIVCKHRCYVLKIAPEKGLFLRAVKLSLPVACLGLAKSTVYV
jgi:hypothetical protein